MLIIDCKISTFFSALVRFSLWVCVLTAPPTTGWRLHSQFSSDVKLVRIQSFPSPRLVAWPKLKSMSYNLPIAGQITDGFKHFSKVLSWRWMQTVSCRIWTQSYRFHLQLRSPSRKGLLYLYAHVWVNWLKSAWRQNSDVKTIKTKLFVSGVKAVDYDGF